jgi:purine-binding chemotaxis protein CheW
MQLENVLEVQTLEQLSTVPNAPAVIRGVIHWRGTILSLVDMSQLFQIPETGIFDVHACVIAEAAGKRLAVAASEVEEILSVPRERVREAPALSSDIDPAWVAGVSEENRLILCMEEIVKHLDQKQ